jgi:hypothetical protein
MAIVMSHLGRAGENHLKVVDYFVTYYCCVGLVGSIGHDDVEGLRNVKNSCSVENSQ